MRIQDFTVSPPRMDLPIVVAADIVAQSAGASASYEVPIFAAHQPVYLNNVKFMPGASVNGGALTTAATGFVNVYRAQTGQATTRLGFDGNVCSFPYTTAGITTAAFVSQDAYAMKGAMFTGYLSAAVTGASSTGATLVAVGNNSLSNGVLEVTAVLNGGTMTLVVEPGTAVAETIQLSAYATTGVFTIAASGTFANSHAAGAQVVMQGAPAWWATAGGAITANTTTSITATALSPSTAGQLPSTPITLVFEPNTSNQENVQGTWTSGTTTFAVSPTYNGGTFAKAHASGCAVALLRNPQTLSKGDVLTFKWTQSATTGLALPASRVEVNYGIAGAMKF